MAALSPTSGGGAPTGAAAGDLAGTYPNPTVKAGVSLTGTPSAPTAAVDTSTVQLATTAFVLAQAASAVPLMSAAAAAVGSSTRYARADHVHPSPGVWTPADHGLIAWSFDPCFISAGTILPVAGTLNLARLKLGAACNITSIVMAMNTGGGTLTAGQCFAAVFQAGALLGVTADQATNWQSNGEKSMALASGPFAATAGDLIVAFYANGTTMPTFYRAAGVPEINTGLSGNTSRYGTADTGRTTTMPGTLGAITAASNPWWVAVK